MCLFCVISQPWEIINSASGLLSFLSGYSCLMGPLAGIIVSDYYLVRQRKLDVRELYKGASEDGGGKSIYWYWNGLNLRAFIAFLLGFLPTLPGFARSIAGFDKNTGAAKLDVKDAWKLYSFAWLFGFTVSTLSYYVICKWISVPEQSFVEVAVLPPLTKEEEDAGEVHYGLEWPVVGGTDGSEMGVTLDEVVVIDEKAGAEKEVVIGK